jgi:hypothetical protein
MERRIELWDVRYGGREGAMVVLDICGGGSRFL